MKSLWLLLLLPVATSAATISGEWRDSADKPVVRGKITFAPVSTPLASNTVTYIDNSTSCSLTNGFFTNSCAGGFYDVTGPGVTRTIRILVPTNNVEYNFNYVAQLATNVPVFVYPVGIPAGTMFTNAIWDLRNNQWAEFLGQNTYYRYTWPSDHLHATNRPFLSYEDWNNGYFIGNQTGQVFGLDLNTYTISGPHLQGTLDGSYINTGTLNSNSFDAATLRQLGPIARGVSSFTNGIRRIPTPYAYITNIYTLTYRTVDGTHSDIYVAFSSVFGGTSFDVKSGNSNDTNVFYWTIFLP